MSTNTYFNEKEFSGSQEDDFAVAEVVDDLSQGSGSGSGLVEDESDDSSLMSNIEERLEVAACYKLLLSDTFFSVDTKAARIVTKRLRQFVLDELETLVGMRNPTPKAAAQFNDIQADALRRIADKVLQREGVPALTPPPVSQPSQTLRKQNVAPVQALAKKVDAVVPVRAPVKRAPATPKRVRPAQSTIKEITSETTPDSKKVFRKEETTEDGRKVQEYLDARGNVLATKDASPQVRPPDAIPMPSPQAMGAVMLQQATASLAAAGEETQAFTAIALNNKG